MPAAKKLVTLEEDEDTRTIRVGLKANGASKQRVVTLYEPGMVKFIELQRVAAEVDEGMPRAPIPEDPQNPTGPEILARADTAREQNKYLFSDERPYGNLFLELIKACSDEDVEAEELPTWALGVDASRRVLDFYKNLSAGPVADALLAAIQQGQ